MTGRSQMRAAFGFRPHVQVGALCALLLSLGACAGTNGTMEGADGTAPNTLSAQEQADGWRLLFNGQDLQNWRGIGRQDVPAQHWVVEDGAMRKVASGDVPKAADGQPIAGGDIITKDTYGDFEFAFDFKLSPGANSGVKYNISEQMSLASQSRNGLGFEYQVLDDERHPDAKMGISGNRTAGALYDMIPPSSATAMRPIGEWNQGRIVREGNHVEHWLNGVKVVEYEIGSADFNQRLAASKYKDIKDFAVNRDGHILLQDHNDDVWYRNVKIRTPR